MSKMTDDAAIEAEEERKLKPCPCPYCGMMFERISPPGGAGHWRHPVNDDCYLQKHRTPAIFCYILLPDEIPLWNRREGEACPICTVRDEQLDGMYHNLEAKHTRFRTQVEQARDEMVCDCMRCIMHRRALNRILDEAKGDAK